MRSAIAPVLAAGFVALIAACATSGDVTGDTSDGTLPDSGASTGDPPTREDVDSGSTSSGNDSGTSSGNDSGTGSSQDSGSPMQTDSGSGSTGTDSGSTSGGGATCSTSGAAAFIYGVEYGSLDDPTAVPCPCGPGDCCFEPGILPAACVAQ